MVNNKNYIYITPILYLIGVILYSIIPELFNVPENVSFAFYWVNNTVFYFLILRLLSNVSLNKRISLFVLLIGIFQIANCFMKIQEYIWISIAVIANILILISCKYGRWKLLK